MTVEEIYTNAFSARLTGWTVTGSSPYLQNTNTDYIRTAVNLREEGDWTFPNSAGSGTINSVKLEFEGYLSTAGCGTVEVYVWDGSSWIDVATIVFDTAYSWKEVDVSTVLNTWAKINGAKVYVHYDRGVAGTCYVRRLTRKVDYMAVAVTETITAKSFPMLYLAKPVKAQELISKVEGATITKVANDFPEEIIKSDKAKELKSKWS
jgi:hypothetical protein